MGASRISFLTELEQKAVALEVKGLVDSRNPSSDQRAALESEERNRITGSTSGKGDVAMYDKREAIEGLVLKHAAELQQTGAMRELTSLEQKAVYAQAEKVALKRIEDEGRSKSPESVQFMIAYEHAAITGVSNPNVSKEASTPIYLDKKQEAAVTAITMEYTAKLVSQGPQTRDAQEPTALAPVVAPEKAITSPVR